MNLIQSIIMGLIQGIAEFLPISSSGHLAIGKNILGLNTEVDMLFDVMLHIGTLVAVFIAFWDDIKELIIEGFSMLRDLFVNLGIAISRFSSKEKKEYRKILQTPYRRFVLMVIISTIPTGIIGILLDDIIEQASKTVLVPGICLLITGVLLLIADNSKSGKITAKDITAKKAGIVGIAQGFATLPGISRSGTTITACLLCGFEKTFAVKYSFIMSIPAIMGAAVLELFKFDDKLISGELVVNYVVGTVVAGIVGYICIKTMLKVVKDKKFVGFAIYCFLIGLISIAYVIFM